MILHWLGEVFDPQLAGYWGSRDIADGDRHFPRSGLRAHARKIDGVKVSLLSAEHEIGAARRACRSGVRLYTGDDFNYPELIEGDGAHHSDALLGAFAAIAPAAAAALSALDEGDIDDYRARDGADAAAVPAHLRGADLLLQDRDRLPGLAERVTKTASRWSAACSRPAPSCTWPGSSSWPTRPGCCTDPELAAHRLGSLLRDRPASAR